MATKKTTAKAEKVEAKKLVKPQVSDFDVIIEPIITEKSMSQTQNFNMAAFKVKKNATKPQIKNAIERIYDVKVLGISTVIVRAKNTTRGSRYHGTISGYKKAIVRIESGKAIDLFKE